MAVTWEQVLNALFPDEPNYVEAAALGPEALPHLERLMRGDNPELAGKAASLAGHIPHPRAAAALQAAVTSPIPTVRVAAAAAARHLPPELATPLITTLMSDDDVGVRKQALAAVQSTAAAELRNAVSAVAAADPNPVLRSLASGVQTRLAPQASPQYEETDAAPMQYPMTGAGDAMPGEAGRPDKGTKAYGASGADMADEGADPQYPMTGAGNAVPGEADDPSADPAGGTYAAGG